VAAGLSLTTDVQVPFRPQVLAVQTSDFSVSAMPGCGCALAWSAVPTIGDCVVVLALDFT